MLDEEGAFLVGEPGEGVRDLLTCSRERGEEHSKSVRSLWSDARALLGPDSEVELFRCYDHEFGRAEGRRDVIREPAHIRFSVERMFEQAIRHGEPERVRCVRVVRPEVKVVARHGDGHERIVERA